MQGLWRPIGREKWVGGGGKRGFACIYAVPMMMTTVRANRFDGQALTLDSNTRPCLSHRHRAYKLNEGGDERAKTDVSS